MEAGVDVIVADSGDQTSVDAVVAQTHVLLSTAGPFALYGTPVVDACVRFGTHYVDITGETHWARELVASYHQRAASEGTKIVPFCGFDSIPSDIGSFLLARNANASTVCGYFQIHGGGFNGGTVATALSAASSGRGAISDGSSFVAPRFDEEIGTWTGPFFMAPVNTWVVRRSAKLFLEWNEPYPAGFTYREFLKFEPPFASLKAIGGTSLLAAFGGAITWAPTRRLLTRLLPKPGEGPSEQKMNEGWFSCDFIGRTSNGERVRGLVQNQGDAGNRSTVKMVCESALALATNDPRLPQRGGVLTPSTGLGRAVVERLRTAGMTLLP